MHVYLSYPFVLGWSLLEAMACGCCIVGSKGMPVEEAIEHNVEGRLIPMDKPDLLAKEVLQLLSSLKVALVLEQQHAAALCFMTSGSLFQR